MNDKKPSPSLRLSLENEKVAAVVEHMSAKINGRLTLNSAGEADVRRWLRRFNIDEILEAIDASFTAYLRFKEDELDEESAETAFRKIPIFVEIGRAQAERPHIRQLLYIQGIIRKRARHPHYDCIDYLEYLVSVGADPDEMESRAKRMRSIEDFEAPYDAWLVQIGRSF